MLLHYPFFIRELGAARGYSTEITKRLHIDCVKEPWRATNHVNPEPQMIGYLEKKEHWALLSAYMHDTGLLIDPQFQQQDDEDDNDDYQGPEDTIEGCGNGVNGGTWQPTPTISIAKRPAFARKRGRDLIDTHGATDLIPATIDYLHAISDRTVIPLDDECSFRVWKRCKLHHRRLPFYPCLDPQTNSVRAFPTTTDEEGQLIHQGFFDIVLFRPSTNDGDDNEGLHGLRAGRVRTIFELPKHLQAICPDKLVYIEHFEPFSARRVQVLGLYTANHAMQAGRRVTSVIPLTQIRMTCHLAPQYSMLDPSLQVSSFTDLLSAHNRFYLNKYASYWIFIILDYWEHQRQLSGPDNNHCLFKKDFPSSGCPRAVGISTVAVLRRLNDHHPLSLDLSGMNRVPSLPSLLTDAAYGSNPASATALISLNRVISAPLVAPMPTAPFVCPSPMSRPPAPVFNSSRHGNDIFPPHNGSPSTFPPSSHPDHHPGQGSATGHVLTSVNNGSTDFSPIFSPGSPRYGSSFIHHSNRTTNRPFEHGFGYGHWKIDSITMTNCTSHGDEREGGHRSNTVDNWIDSRHSEETRRRCIVELEQQRRDTLRDGFVRLKDVLPVSRDKFSRIGLLIRATNHIRHLEDLPNQAEGRLAMAESEVARLHQLSEAYVLAGRGN
ncbi:hypothetical protein FRC08_018808 [Ceratobasidium sp. 394]|nr:hypothetical protein FRC08_018808 [Ceratobasidium sp. 394]